MTECLCACCCTGCIVAPACWLHSCTFVTDTLFPARLHPLCPFLHVADACALSASACCPSCTLYTLTLCSFPCALVPAICLRSVFLCGMYRACRTFLPVVHTLRSICSDVLCAPVYPCELFIPVLYVCPVLWSMRSICTLLYTWHSFVRYVLRVIYLVQWVCALSLLVCCSILCAVLGLFPCVPVFRILRVFDYTLWDVSCVLSVPICHSLPCYTLCTVWLTDCPACCLCLAVCLIDVVSWSQLNWIDDCKTDWFDMTLFGLRWLIQFDFDLTWFDLIDCLVCWSSVLCLHPPCRFRYRDHFWRRRPSFRCSLFNFNAYLFFSVCCYLIHFTSLHSKLKKD